MDNQQDLKIYTERIKVQMGKPNHEFIDYTQEDQRDL